MSAVKKTEPSSDPSNVDEREKEPTKSGVGEKGQKPKRRRWTVLLAVLVALLFLIVLAAPWIISRPTVSNYVLSFANATVRGDIRVEKLSLTWFGPSTLDQLNILDPQNRPVISARRVQVASGVWKLITARDTFGEIVVDSPEVVLHLDDDNQVSIADAFQPINPTSSTEVPERAEPLSIPQGTIKITNGIIRLARGETNSYDATEFNTDLEITSLNQLEGAIELKLDGASSLKAEISVTNLAPDGSIDVRQASGTVALTMDRPAQVGSLAEILLQRKGLRGEAKLQLDARIEPDDLFAEIEANVSGLQTEERAAGNASPLDAAVIGSMRMKDGQITASADLSGTPGTAHTDLTYRAGDTPPKILADDIVSAIFGGESLSLPEFSLKAESDIDLAAFDRAAPGLLPLQDGQTLSSGNLKISSLSITGGDVPAVSGSVHLANLRARNATRTTELDPLSLEIDVKLDSAAGMLIERADLTSNFATVRTSGSIDQMRAQFQSDLTLLHNELGQIIDLGPVELSGQLTGLLTVSRVDDQHLDTMLELDAQQLRYAHEDEAIQLPRATITQKGHVGMRDGRVARIESAELVFDLDGQVVAAGHGWYDMQTQALSAKINLRQADLGFVSQRAKAFGTEELARFSGNVLGEIAVERATGTEPLRSSGRLAGQRLAADGRPLLDQDATLTWSDGEFDPTDGQVALQTALLTSDLGDVRISDVRFDSGADGAHSGKVNGTIDLARVLGIIATLSEQEQPADIRGRLAFDAGISQETEGIRIAGTGSITPLEMGSGDSTVREEKVEFEYDAMVDTQARRVLLGTSRVLTEQLTAELSGVIDKYDTDMIASLTGRYNASWSELTVLLHELVPAAAELVVVEGTSASEFKITGPLFKADTQPAFLDATAECSVLWNSAQLAGVNLGKAKLTPKLSKGHLQLPATELSAVGGTVRLAGMLDFRPPEPTLLMPGTNPILKGVAITPELTRELLSRINPVFYYVASAQGQVNLTVSDLVFPLGDTGRDTATGNGQLELVDMMVEPSGFLKDLLALGGSAMEREMIAVGVKGLDFAVKDGRIAYRDFTLMFPDQFDLKFYGSVGLDETLDLTVSMPVRPELLERLGVSGSTAKYAQDLLGKRVDIPIVGTREQPVLDFASVDKNALLGDTLKKSAEESIGGLLNGFLKDKKKRDKKPRKRGD